MCSEYIISETSLALVRRVLQTIYVIKRNMTCATFVSISQQFFDKKKKDRDNFKNFK